ncbi:hypothetical protein BHE74_00056844, partial [Ensete ventricosum]
RASPLSVAIATAHASVVVAFAHTASMRKRSWPLQPPPLSARTVAAYSQLLPSCGHHLGVATAHQQLSPVRVIDCDGLCPHVAIVGFGFGLLATAIGMRLL